ncbi:MAG: TonB-dependent receptor [bacterium]|nr:TonB-dependent receptor [bacterium]
MWRAFLFSLFLTVSGATGPRAQTDLAGGASPVELPDSIVVTANRFGLTPDKALWPAAVVSKNDLDLQVSLPQTLDGVSGADVREYNGVGSVSTLSSWGVFNRHMLLLYDGRVVKDYSLGGFNLSEFSPGEFERIEIVKGPQSAFYGADAVGGVVNLISRTALIDRMEVAARYGSNDLQQYRADASRLIGRVGVGASAEFTASDNARPNAGAERTLAGVRSEYVSPNDRHHVSLSARYFKDSLGVPGPMPDPTFIPVYGDPESNSLYNHQTDENYSFDARYAFQDDKVGRFQVDLFWEKKELIYSGLYNYQSFYYTPNGPDDSTLNIDSVDNYSQTVYDKRSAGISGRYMREMSTVSLSGGLDWLSGSVRSTGTDTSIGTNILGPFAPFEYGYGGQSRWTEKQNQVDTWAAAVWEASRIVRFDASGRFQFVKGRETQPSYNLGVIVNPSDYASLKLAYGFAFRLPTIAEQFADDTYTAGNVDLSPETSRSLVGTLAVVPASSPVSARLSVFRQQVDSLIQYVYDPTVFKSSPRNVEKFRSTGLDLSLDVRPLESLDLALGMVYQGAEQTSDGGKEFEKADYVPDLKWRVGANVELSRMLSAGLSLLYTSERQLLMYGGSLKTIDNVYELGASVSARVNGHLRLVLTAEDLTDEKRPDQFGFTPSDHDYPGVGRRVYLKAVARVL